MSFEIKYQTKTGLFHVRIERDVSAQEAHELAQLGLNITYVEEEKVYGPPLAPDYQRDDIVSHIRNESPSLGPNSQTKLGEKPVAEINMLSYVEPKEGVRIKMVAFPESRTKALQVIREHTGISLIGCKDIVYGNYLCPILNLEIANKIMADFRKLGVHAKIVPADNQSSAA